MPSREFFVKNQPEFYGFGGFEVKKMRGI